MECEGGSLENLMMDRTPRPNSRSVRSVRAHRTIVLWIALLAVNGCDRPPSPARPDPETVSRLTELRSRLQHQLGEDYDRPIAAATNEQLRRGAKHYQLLCSACHGRDGRGSGRQTRRLALPPPDLTDPQRGRFFSDRAKLEIIRRGIDGSPMIGWDRLLNEEELHDVFLFTRSLERTEP